MKPMAVCFCSGVARDTLAGEKLGKGSSSVKQVPVLFRGGVRATCPNKISSTDCSNEKVTFVTFRREILRNCVRRSILSASQAACGST